MLSILCCTARRISVCTHPLETQQASDKSHSPNKKAQNKRSQNKKAAAISMAAAQGTHPSVLALSSSDDKAKETDEQGPISRVRPSRFCLHVAQALAGR